MDENTFINVVFGPPPVHKPLIKPTGSLGPFCPEVYMLQIYCKPDPHLLRICVLNLFYTCGNRYCFGIDNKYQNTLIHS